MIKTSRATNNSGFTILEIMIVIALVALVSAVGVSSLTGAFRSGKDGAPRKMALTMREARDYAMLRDRLVRMRFDFEKQEYFFEEAPSSYLLQKQTEKSLTQREQEARDEKEKNTFKLSNAIGSGKTPLPNGLKVEEIQSPRNSRPITEGVADVFFYNNGSADGVTIAFLDEEGPRQWLTLNPVTGQSKISSKPVGKP